MNSPRYPLYIVSKGRWQYSRRLTNRALEWMGTKHYIVVEEQEADDYRAVVNPDLATILVLDPLYQKNYDACCDLEEGASRGSGPARNFAWEHAAANGHERYWCVDDNIQYFGRLVQNMKMKIGDGTVFRVMEDFTDRYSNIAMSGPNYFMFLPRKDPGIRPFVANTRIYSCNLIKTDLPFRWRGRYNEDTILSLDLLKAGYCTVLFNALWQKKITTQKIKGGNTDELYKHGTVDKSQMLVNEHPDVSRLTWKFGRVHHQVDYSPFRYRHLQRREDIDWGNLPTVDEYGMRLVRLDTNEPQTAAIEQAARC